jgi:hypothetical protein
VGEKQKPPEKSLQGNFSGGLFFVVKKRRERYDVRGDVSG